MRTLLFFIIFLQTSLLCAQHTASHRRWAYFIEKTQVQSPAVGSGGTIYIGTGLGDTSRQSDGVYAINPDGTLKWKLTMGRTIHSSVAIDSHENLYFIVGNANSPDKMDASLDALDSSGHFMWKYDSIGWMAPIPNTGFTPAIAADGTIYVNGRYSLFAISPNGTMKWKYDFPLIDNVVQSGATETLGNHRTAPTIANDGTIYVNTKQGGHERTTVEGGLFAFDPNGNLKWRTHDLGGCAAPVIDKDGTIYSAIGRYENYADTSDWTAAARDAKLLAIHPDGTLKWSVHTDLWIESSPSIGADGTLYVGTSHHPLIKPAWFYAITPEGNIKWKYDTYDDVKDNPYAQINPPDIYNSPAVDANGLVYFGNELGLFYALTPDGHVAWMEDVSSLMYGSPALVGDGTLYVATHEIIDQSHYALIAMNTGSAGLANSPWPKFRQNNANTGKAGAFGPSEIVEHAAGPGTCGLSPNYPNPFNPRTKIGFRVSGLGSSWVRLVVYDALGREVAVLVNERRNAGVYEVEFDGSGLASGVYLYRLQVRPLDSAVGRDSKNGAGAFTETKKLFLVR
jgi:outer membrane protein assembly factor BamB